MAFLDISTGEFFVAEGDREYADKLLQSFKPAEVIFQRHQQKHLKNIWWQNFIPIHWMNGSLTKHMQKKVC